MSRFASAPPPAAWDLGAVSAAITQACARRADIVLLDLARSALLRREIARGVLLVGDPAEWLDLKRSAFREWRDAAPRFRRCADAMLRRLVEGRR